MKLHVVVVRVDEESFKNILLETENNLVNRIERRLHDNNNKKMLSKKTFKNQSKQDGDDDVV